MRPNPLFTLLSCSVTALLALLAWSADTHVAAASTLPGAGADLARDHGVPQSGEGPFPYVIVTRRALRDEFMALARERVRDGIASRVRSLESLRSDYPVAADDPERVRHFLHDAYEHWGTRWVLLGGDTDVIPPRYATVRGNLPERRIVSDWYFACLDGTWDADGDGLYGELAEPGDPGDEPDLQPELFLGRAPVRDQVEARRFVEKTLAYERRPVDAFEHTTLLFAHRSEFGIDSPKCSGIRSCACSASRRSPPAAHPAGVRRPIGTERHEPTSLTLSAPVPSPAVSWVRVECAMSAAAAGAGFDAAIVDLAGRFVRTLRGTASRPGVATVTWDLRDSAGLRVRSGVYFLRVRAGGSSQTTRLVVGRLALREPAA